MNTSEILRRIRAIEAELTTIKTTMKIGWWECRCCQVMRAPEWFTYRVRGHQKDPWIEPACAMCARDMFSEGPFPPPSK